ncbi:hypothetical protein C8R44DRAFT_741114 [Mycena epipterygia]|nr:hypothetical protein C8R44DRAFT_741114 [Mycena epipterygia]
MDLERSKNTPAPLRIKKLRSLTGHPLLPGHPGENLECRTAEDLAENIHIRAKQPMIVGLIRFLDAAVKTLMRSTWWQISICGDTDHDSFRPGMRDSGPASPEESNGSDELKYTTNSILLWHNGLASEFYHPTTAPILKEAPLLFGKFLQ